MTLDQQLTTFNERVAVLETELTALKAENHLLRLKLGPAVWRIDGNKAEEFVFELVGGRRTTGSAQWDIRTANGERIEIKFANLNEAVGEKQLVDGCGLTFSEATVQRNSTGCCSSVRMTSVSENLPEIPSRLG